ncbi:unnamed protein product, partial [Durusdinium trenchii]
ENGSRFLLNVSVYNSDVQSLDLRFRTNVNTNQSRLAEGKEILKTHDKNYKDWLLKAQACLAFGLEIPRSNPCQAPRELKKLLRDEPQRPRRRSSSTSDVEEAFEEALTNSSRKRGRTSHPRNRVQTAPALPRFIKPSPNHELEDDDAISNLRYAWNRCSPNQRKRFLQTVKADD